MENQIEKILQTSGLQPAQAKPLLDSFGGYFIEAHKLVTKGKGIKVTDITQIAEMQQAREIRLSLAKLRVEADKTRVMLKEGYNLGGNAVQAIYNEIRDIVKPEEDRLFEQEKFKERRDLFIENNFHALLNNHSVAPTYPNWRSINITGSFRALFEVKEKEKVVFMKIGTHSELYK